MFELAAGPRSAVQLEAQTRQGSLQFCAKQTMICMKSQTELNIGLATFN